MDTQKVNRGSHNGYWELYPARSMFLISKLSLQLLIYIFKDSSSTPVISVTSCDIGRLEIRDSGRRRGVEAGLGVGNRVMDQASEQRLEEVVTEGNLGKGPWSDPGRDREGAQATGLGAEGAAALPGDEMRRGCSGPTRCCAKGSLGGKDTRSAVPEGGMNE